MLGLKGSIVINVNQSVDSSDSHSGFDPLR